MQGRKLLIIIGAIVAVLGLVAAYLFFGNNSSKQEQYLYIPTGANYDTVTAIPVSYTHLDVYKRQVLL